MRLSHTLTRLKGLLRPFSLLQIPSSTPLSFFRDVRPPVSPRPNPEELFAYTAGRWLCNDELQRKLRYTPFNIEALEQIACGSIGAKRCLSWEKIGEGSFNKVFLLQFDNDKKICVRIPCPVIGNVEHTIASEVATMTYISECWASNEHLAKPPKVIAWDASYRNPAETPYIILEYSPGVTLHSRWPDIQGDVADAALRSMSRLETPLLAHQFSRYGSLFFAEDVPDELRQLPLYPTTPEDPLHKTLATRYRIGPTVYREWWRGEYGRVDADRGPWPDVQTMIKSAAEFQLRALDSGAALYSPLVKTKPSDVPLLRDLLQTCIRIAPYIVPTEPAMNIAVLNHPDLSLDNLIVPPDGLASVMNTIDWQGTTISPFFMQCGLPPALQYARELITIPKDGSLPLWPTGFDAMPEEDKRIVRIQHRFACRYRRYSLITMFVDPMRVLVWQLPYSGALMDLVPFITRCIADGPSALRGFLIEFQQNWGIIDDSGRPCPIAFTEQEIAAHLAEESAQEEYLRNVEELFGEIGCTEGGLVSARRFAAAKEIMEQRQAEWDEVAMKGPFPLYDGAHTTILT